MVAFEPHLCPKIVGKVVFSDVYLSTGGTFPFYRGVQSLAVVRTLKSLPVGKQICLKILAILRGSGDA